MDTRLIASIGSFLLLTARFPAIVCPSTAEPRFHNAAVGRAQHLEGVLGFMAFGGDANPGLFGSRRDVRRRRILGLPVGHDIGLSLVYASALGTWAFAFFFAGEIARSWIAGLIGLAVAAALFVQLQILDGRLTGVAQRVTRLRDPERVRLAELDARIPGAENRGERTFFDTLVADEFVMRRASGVLVAREAFIDGLAVGGDRAPQGRTTVTMHGKHRATVASVVRMTDDGVSRRFGNLRVFVRTSSTADWRLVAWVNEVL